MPEWIATNGKAPRNKETLYHVRFRNGLESQRPYIAKQMTWHHRDPADPCHAWDVVAVARADQPQG